MKHFGDITKLSGYDLPVVDVITGGSPCQDLSVAGKRAGLAGERSGLFMEQMRIVKEMRSLDRKLGRSAWAVRPRYMVWENVPGAFSSGTPKGADFAAVIEEIVKVAEPDACVHVCVPGGGWTKSGCYYAEDGSWSIAWRVHDAQFWGVPQRRKRIALVADFGGLSAPEILFERKGLSGDTEPGGTAREETAGAAGGRIGGAEPILLESNQNHATVQTDGISTALPASMGMGGGYVPMVVGFKQGNGAKAGGIGVREECSPTLSAVASGTNQVPAVYDARGNGNGRLSPALTGDSQSCVTDYTAICIGNWQTNQSVDTVAGALNCMHDQQAVIVLNDQGGSVMDVSNDISGTLRAQSHGHEPIAAHALRAKANVVGREDTETYPMTNNTVRRLTPMECERLQGYPDGWTDIGEWTDSKGKKHAPADSPRYKALGNSIALPFWCWLARRICAQYERPVTMGSLFDGIGGFPLAFERAGAKAVWASEIEEFPIAVTKKHFPEVEP